MKKEKNLARNSKKRAANKRKNVVKRTDYLINKLVGGHTIEDQQKVKFKKQKYLPSYKKLVYGENSKEKFTK